MRPRLLQKGDVMHTMYCLFGLKNSPVVFFDIIISPFREYMHKFLELYMDDWIVYILLKKHESMIRVMFY